VILSRTFFVPILTARFYSSADSPLSNLDHYVRLPFSIAKRGRNVCSRKVWSDADESRSALPVRDQLARIY
jgi:hypothetical protein